MDQPYDLIAVGSSFATAFFLDGYLGKARLDATILVLERGRKDPLSWQVENRQGLSLQTNAEVRNETGKEFVYNLAVGGASNT